MSGRRMAAWSAAGLCGVRTRKVRAPDVAAWPNDRGCFASCSPSQQVCMSTFTALPSHASRRRVMTLSSTRMDNPCGRVLAFGGGLGAVMTQNVGCPALKKTSPMG